jgi:hypothetical protein
LLAWAMIAKCPPTCSKPGLLTRIAAALEALAHVQSMIAKNRTAICLYRTV